MNWNHPYIMNKQAGILDTIRTPMVANIGGGALAGGLGSYLHPEQQNSAIHNMLAGAGLGALGMYSRSHIGGLPGRFGQGAMYGTIGDMVLTGGNNPGTGAMIGGMAGLANPFLNAGYNTWANSSATPWEVAKQTARTVVPTFKDPINWGVFGGVL
jgi:hypothetical protein